MRQSVPKGGRLLRKDISVFFWNQIRCKRLAALTHGVYKHLALLLEVCSKSAALQAQIYSYHHVTYSYTGAQPCRQLLMLMQEHSTDYA